MGTLIGLACGVGLALILWARSDPEWRPSPRVRRHRLRELLAEAGLSDGRPSAVVAATLAAFVVTTLLVTAISGVLVVGLVLGALASTFPVAMLRGRALRRRRASAALWPDAVDHLASAVRAGLSLPEAIIQLGERGPEGLRDPFLRFARDHQATGRFHDSLDRLKERLADPTGDRVVEALRLARDVGGGDLGRMLRSLSGFLRDDLRTRGELEARQSWTVTGARLAVAAPWLVLLAMSFQRDVIARYATPTGTTVLVVAAVVCVVAYRLMLRIGRLPTEQRVLA